MVFKIEYKKCFLYLCNTEMYKLVDYFMYVCFFNEHISKIYLPREIMHIIFSYIKDELIYKINKKTLTHMVNRKLYDLDTKYFNMEKKYICIHSHVLQYKWTPSQVISIMSEILKKYNYYFYRNCCSSGIIFSEMPYRKSISFLDKSWNINVFNDSYTKQYTDEMCEKYICLCKCG